MLILGQTPSASLFDTTANCGSGTVQIKVTPPQSQQLSSADACGSSEYKQHIKPGAVRDFQQPDRLVLI